MGSGLSKHEDEQQQLDSKSKKDYLSKEVKDLAKKDEREKDSLNIERSACPMAKGDGSYGIDLFAMFRRGFPHGPTGSKPFTKEEIREKATNTKEVNALSASTDVEGCPVRGSSMTTNDESSSREGCPVRVSSTTAGNKDSSGGGCPVQQSQYSLFSQTIDPKNNMPAVPNQLPASEQSKALSTDRAMSTIPKGTDEGSAWVYPSPQMFYNALARKGKLNDADEDEMTSVVAIHNNMNEKTWNKVVEWEKLISPGTGQPMLLKFCGRPHDLSPKAMIKHYVLGHPLPYDRHDWTILRGDGSTVRYVIDYYYDESRAGEDEQSAMPLLHDVNGTPSLLVDLRPALDSPVQLWNRLVTMPFAQNFSKSTSFEYLPMLPTADMQSQVKGSVQVWQDAKAIAAKQGEEENANSHALRISDKEARELAKSFGKMLGDCRSAQEELNNCKSEKEYGMKSVDLTICMAKIICPSQHERLLETLQDEDSASSDTKLEAALEDINECVLMKTQRHAAAREQYPIYF